jgi:hypothetical protein
MVIRDDIQFSPATEEKSPQVRVGEAESKAQEPSGRRVGTVQRQMLGLARGRAPIARRIFCRYGLKVLVWDMNELAIIFEIASRLPTEGADKVAKDLWKRGARDRRRRLWGMQRAKPSSRFRTPYQQFYRASRWFYRMKREGKLPTPYDLLAQFLPEPKPRTHRSGKRTPGGTARREQERAEAKARHHAERVARWERERLERLQRRVHKPVLPELDATPLLTVGGVGQ